METDEPIKINRKVLGILRNFKRLRSLYIRDENYVGLGFRHMCKSFQTDQRADDTSLRFVMWHNDGPGDLVNEGAGIVNMCKSFQARRARISKEQTNGCLLLGAHSST
jgi:hypothetical protein